MPNMEIPDSWEIDLARMLAREALETGKIHVKAYALIETEINRHANGEAISNYGRVSENAFTFEELLNKLDALTA